MNESDVKAFLNTGLETWKRIKKDFSSEAMSNFLMKAYPVLACGHRQIDLDLAKNLYKPLYSDEKKAKPEEVRAENLRLEIVDCIENNLHSLSLEERFPYVDIDLIEELRTHPELKDINHESRASVRVVIHTLF